MKTSIITTQRLIIRPLTEEDYDAICEYGCNEIVGQYMLHWPKSKDQIKEFISDRIDDMQQRVPSWYEYSIITKDSCKMIGNCSVILDDNMAEIGWLLNASYWNRGFMSEAAKAVIDYAFTHLPIEYILATCSSKNIGSYRVMEKCNMKLISTEFNLHAIKNGVPVIYDRLKYRINKDEANG